MEPANPVQLASDLDRLSLALEYLDLPDEKWFEIEVLVPQEGLARFCSQSRRFRNICSDPSFWRQRLEKWYPEVSLKGLTEDKYKACYQLAFADELDKKAANILEKAKEAPEVKAIQPKLRAIRTDLEYHHGSQREAMLKEKHDLIQQRKTILEPSRNQAVSLAARATKMRNEASRILPSE
jgi:hypothetical protein